MDPESQKTKIEQNENLLCLDIGNSAIKAALYHRPADGNSFGNERGRAVRVNLLTKAKPAAANNDSRFDPLFDLIDSATCNWFACTVNHPVLESLKTVVGSRRPEDNFVVFDHNDYPFDIAVQQPAQIGVDRLLAAAAASVELQSDDPAKNTNLIVIDAGTAVTIDVVDANRRFLGGVIRAGTRLQRSALHTYTAALPDLSESSIDAPNKVIGENTVEAILSGTFYGEVGAILGLVELLADQLGESTQVVLTGGGALELQSILPADWLRRESLVLDGVRIAASNKLFRS